MIFASKIKAIYVAMDDKPEVDYNAIDNILRYTFNPGRNTVFHEIKKVLPGEMVTFYNGKISNEKYWELKNIEEGEKIDGSKYKN